MSGDRAQLPCAGQRYPAALADRDFDLDIAPRFRNSRTRWQQHIMGVAVQGKNREVGKGDAAPFAVDLPIRRIAADSFPRLWGAVAAIR